MEQRHLTRDLYGDEDAGETATLVAAEREDAIATEQDVVIDKAIEAGSRHSASGRIEPPERIARRRRMRGSSVI